MTYKEDLNPLEINKELNERRFILTYKESVL